MSSVHRSKHPTSEAPAGLSDGHFRKIMQASLDGYVLTDDRGGILDANGAFCRLLGYSLQELQQIDARSLDVRLGAPALQAHLQQAWRQGEAHLRTALRRKDDSTVEVEVSVTVVTLDDGRFAVAFVRDITEAKRSEASLQRNTALLEQVQALANLGIWEWVIPENRVSWSPQLCDIYGVGRDGAASFEGYLARVHPEDRERVQAEVGSALEKRGAFTFYERIVRSDGEVRWLRSWGRVTCDAGGNPERMYGVCLDVTETVLAREKLVASNEKLEARVEARTRELAVAKERAESADRLKSSFLATMSHELRTPLNSILGFAGILSSGMAGPINDEQAKQLTMVRESSEHLLALINDVLDLSKIEAGELRLSKETFEVHERVQQVVAHHRLAADSKGLELSAEAFDVGQLHSDRRRFEQILHNLLSNAIKFTDRGAVRIRCERRDGELRVAVSDTGIGMPAEELPNLFRPFHQLDNELSRRHEGTGLGLSISNRLAGLLGGRIEAESVQGEGSTFTLTLPGSGPEVST